MVHAAWERGAEAPVWLAAAVRGRHERAQGLLTKHVEKGFECSKETQSIVERQCVGCQQLQPRVRGAGAEESQGCCGSERCKAGIRSVKKWQGREQREREGLEGG